MADPDPIDNLVHEIVHDLARMYELALHIDNALKDFIRLARDCPYAGEPGCVCKKVSDAFKNHRE